MTPQKAKVIFATHMQAARTRKLTTYEKDQLSKARQTLRTSRKPAMNPEGKKDRYTGWINGKRVTTGYTISETVQRLYDELKSDKYAYLKGEPFIDVQVRAKFKGVEQTVFHRSIKRNPKAKSNPKQPGVLIYQHVDRIYATKGPGHICDEECSKNGHRYFHDFKTRPKMYGLPDGSILIKS